MKKLQLLFACITLIAIHPIQCDFTETTLKCAGFYAGGIATEATGRNLKSPGLRWMGSIIGSPIKSAISSITTASQSDTLVSASHRIIFQMKPKKSRKSLNFIGNPKTVQERMLRYAVKRSLPAFIGFGLIPYFIEKYNHRI